MKRSWWFRFSVLVVLTVLSIMMIIPTFVDLKEDSSYPIKGKINMGLDLQGGLYMTLGIDFKKVYREEIKNYAQKFLYILDDKGLKAKLGDWDLSDPFDPKHSILLENEGEKDRVREVIKEYFPTSYVRLTHLEGAELQYGLAPTLKNEIETQSVNKSIEVIRNRIDEFGVSEPEIVSQGSDRIVIQLPGVKDIDRAKKLIGQTAKLEFKMVNDEFGMVALQELITKAEKEGIEYKKGDKFSAYLFKLNAFLKKDLPAGFEVAFQRVGSVRGRGGRDSGEAQDMAEGQYVPFLVTSVAKLSGEDLQDASVQIDPQKNLPYVSMTFKPRGAKTFEEVTGENKGKRLAVILDGNIYTAPVINERIAGGRAQITLGQGNFNQLLTQAKDIALVLRAGALPVQLDFEEQRVVGPGLGATSVAMAETAATVGAIFVFLFILYYYRFSGFLACVGLSLNLIFILSILVGLEATLTLPGLAGIALTIGMAIDATIVIYERIKEELPRKGMIPVKAVENGFNSAFWTIIDANVTTALAGFCLFNFGTGPVRGFATTLLIGIVATVYTSYFVGKLFFEWYLLSRKPKTLSI